MVTGEPRAEELNRPVEQVRKAVARYLGMLESDATTVTATRTPHPVTALLGELYRQDRLLERSEARHENPEKQRRRRAQDLVAKLVEFTNADLGNSHGSAPLWEATLLALIPNFYPQADFRSSLQELQREVSRILRQIALADRWGNSEAFFRLWSNPSWNPPRRDRSGFEFFGRGTWQTTELASHRPESRFQCISSGAGIRPKSSASVCRLDREILFSSPLTMPLLFSAQS